MENLIVVVAGATYKRIGLRQLRSALRLSLVLLLTVILVITVLVDRTVEPELTIPAEEHVLATGWDHWQSASVQDQRNTVGVPAPIGDCGPHSICHALATFPFFRMPEWEPAASVAAPGRWLILSGIAFSPPPHPPKFF
ncbi:hypothetical protein [Leisingera sp. F5]|uniref:hypothetical protein n=1 Tax=Leisingera sp. F5 TaxID=1813816 RepID=UPI0004876CB8|nr:hypothetical protein [Leisingera sp. F5]